jgi:hypothetical protein
MVISVICSGVNQFRSETGDSNWRDAAAGVYPMQARASPLVSLRDTGVEGVWSQEPEDAAFSPKSGLARGGAGGGFGAAQEVGFSDFDGTKPISRKWVWIVGVAGKAQRRWRVSAAEGRGLAGESACPTLARQEGVGGAGFHSSASTRSSGADWDRRRSRRIRRTWRRCSGMRLCPGGCVARWILVNSCGSTRSA